MKWLSKNRNYLYRVAIGAGMIVLVLVVWGTVNLYCQRKDTESMIASRYQMAAETEEAKSFLSDTVEYQGKTYRRNSYMKAILCMGVDRSGSMTEATTTGFGGQADGIMLIAQDTARGKLQFLMIPRDTMTDITLTDLSGNVLGKDMQHLLLAYTYGDGREKSCEYMTEAVSELLCGLKIDYYMAVNTTVIAALNDSVGGVTVTVDEDGTEKQVTLQGSEAEAFVRYRDTDRDHSALYRMDQHQEYITGFFRALKEKKAENSQIIPQLFEQIQDNMVTNMGKELYLKIAAEAVEAGGVADEDFHTVPGTGVTTQRYDEFYADEEALIPVILELFYRQID